jgi:hypothetical protein
LNAALGAQLNNLTPLLLLGRRRGRGDEEVDADSLVAILAPIRLDVLFVPVIEIRPFLVELDLERKLFSENSFKAKSWCPLGYNLVQKTRTAAIAIGREIHFFVRRSITVYT